MHDATRCRDRGCRRQGHGGFRFRQDAERIRTPIVLDRGEGEALWFNNDLLILKATGAETGGSFADSGSDTCAEAASDTIAPSAPENLEATAAGMKKGSSERAVG